MAFFRCASVRLCVVFVAGVGLNAGCSPSGPLRTPPEADVVIGSYAFTESTILAQIYKIALEEEGWKVRLVEGVSSREVMVPALDQGVVDVVPEYEGTLAAFFAVGEEGEAGIHASLKAMLQARGLELVGRAPAQNRNEIVVTRTTALRLGLEEISDLVDVAPDLVFGGPPECPVRPLCLMGLEEVYGLRFKDFQPLDPGGPLTEAALRGGEIDVGLLFTTDPALLDVSLIVLRDDRDLQPPEHIAPVARAEVVAALGPGFSRTLARVNRSLTTVALRALTRRVDEDGIAPIQVARDWLGML